MPPIEKGIPMPPLKERQKRQPRESKWLKHLDAMVVGDSFRLPTFKVAAVYAQAKELGMKIIVKRDGKMYDPDDWRPRLGSAPCLYSASRVWIHSR